MAEKTTVRSVTFDLLRSLGLTTVQEFKTALGAGTTTVNVVATQPQKAML